MTERSLRVTAAYRARLARLMQLVTALPWTVDLQDIDGTGQMWIADTAEQVTVVQAAAATLAAGYVAAYVATETGTAPAPIEADDSAAGQADDGRPLTVALATALIAVKASLKRGYEPGQALRFGEERGRLMVANAAAAAPRQALQSAMDGDERVVGWRRVTRGGCGACLAAADNTVQTGRFKVHPHCECTAEPVVAGVRDAILRPTGREVFHSWPAERQDALLGEEKAALIRKGEVPFERLIQPQPMVVAPDAITEAPLAALL